MGTQKPASLSPSRHRLTTRSCCSLFSGIASAALPASPEEPRRPFLTRRDLHDGFLGYFETCTCDEQVETISTLRFGTRAKIQNKAKINEERSVDELKAAIVKTQRLVDEYRSQIRFQQQLRRSRAGKGLTSWIGASGSLRTRIRELISTLFALVIGKVAGFGSSSPPNLSLRRR